MGVLVDLRWEDTILVVYTTRGFQTWLITEDGRWLLDEIEV